MVRNGHGHTTCLQPHEQLLVGWMVGGMTMTRGDDGDGENEVTREEEE
jgi:hypothetical protein